jgi:alkylated DNA repair dioxygenase AlkB
MAGAMGDSSQHDLFDEPEAGPPGLIYRAGFIDAAEEAALIRGIASLELREAAFKAFTAKRRAAVFGWSHDFGANVLRRAPPIPAFLDALRDRVATWMGEPPHALAHVLINEYRPGVQLGWHRDVPSFARVAGVSLGASCRMRFRPYPVSANAREGVVVRVLAPRSAYLMDGDARWRWQHAVPPVPGQRWSITFRTLAEHP